MLKVGCLLCLCRSCFWKKKYFFIPVKCKVQFCFFFKSIFGLFNFEIYYVLVLQALRIRGLKLTKFF